ncbi:MAG: flagellar hook-length control protein FliK [Phycisphaerales bacterium]|nr:flagellar hook-length control protein FliK [Phycisphaerales bacterium]
MRSTAADEAARTAQGSPAAPGQRQSAEKATEPDSSSPGARQQPDTPATGVAGVVGAAPPSSQANGAGAGGPGAGAVTAVKGPGAGSAGGQQSMLGSPLGTGTGRGPASARRAAQSAPTRASGQAFRTQLVQGLAAALRRGTGEVVLKLRPASLGDVRVQLQLKGSSVDARIRASTSQAHQLLESSVDSLRAALESRGLHVGRIEIEPAPNSPNPGAEHTLGEGREQPGLGGSGAGGEHAGGAPRDSAGPGEGGGAPADEGAREDGSPGDPVLGLVSHPGVVYGVADGAARIVMVDALA